MHFIMLHRCELGKVVIMLTLNEYIDVMDPD